MKPDARVQFPDSVAPADRSLAEGIITLADRLAKGDAPGLKTLITPKAAGVIDDLIASERWNEGTSPIEQVRVVAVSNTQEAAPSESLVGFAVQDRGAAYLLAWQAKRDGDKWVFENAVCQPDEKPRASDFDGVEISTSTELSAAAAPETTASGGAPAAPGTTPKPAAPEPPPNDSGPIRKNTPAGPINIPRPPGGG
jgi:hypothetical protein